MSAYRDDQRALVERLQRENARLREGRRWPVPDQAAWWGVVGAWVAIAWATDNWILVVFVAALTSAAIGAAWYSGHDACADALRERARAAREETLRLGADDAPPPVPPRGCGPASGPPRAQRHQASVLEALASGALASTVAAMRVEFEVVGGEEAAAEIERRREP